MSQFRRLENIKLLDIRKILGEYIVAAPFNPFTRGRWLLQNAGSKIKSGNQWIFRVSGLKVPFFEGWQQCLPWSY